MSDKVIHKKTPRGELPLTEAWTLQVATAEEVEAARSEYKQHGKCIDHPYVTFDAGWLYDDCNCAICGHHSWV